MIFQWALHDEQQIREISANFRTSLMRSLICWNILLIGGSLLLYPLDHGSGDKPSTLQIAYAATMIIATLVGFIFTGIRVLPWINEPMRRYDQWGVSPGRTALAVCLSLSIFPIAILQLLMLVPFAALITSIQQQSEILATLAGIMLCLAMNLFFWGGLYGAEYLRIVLCQHPEIPRESGA